MSLSSSARARTGFRFTPVRSLYVFGAQLEEMGAAAFIKVFHAGGFKSYQLALVIVNAISKALLGHGLRLAGDIYLVRLRAMKANEKFALRKGK